MNSKSQILNYYSDLVDKIDLKTETELIKLCPDSQDERQLLNTLRDSFISTINQIQNSNINNLVCKSNNKFGNKFCFLVESKSHKLYKLVILNEYINNKITSLIEKRIDEPCMYTNDNCLFGNFKDHVIFYILTKFLRSRKDEPITDLSIRSKNLLEVWNIGTEFDEIKKSDFEFLTRNFNTSVAKEFNFFNFYTKNITNNNITNFNTKNFPIEVFEKFENLEKIKIKIKKFTLITEFPQLSHLCHLELVNNDIEDIENNAFFNLKNLKYLNLKDNLIANIRNGMFDGLENLISLDLIENKIENVEANSFLCLKNLYSLNLNRNCIKSLNKDSFNGLSILKVLSLNSNKGLDLAYDTFNACLNLTLLDLSNNKIKALDPRLFNSNDNLRVVKLSQNHLNNYEFLNNLINLEILDIRGCENRLDQIFCPSLKLLQVSCDVVSKFSVNLQNIQCLCVEDVIEFQKSPFDMLKNLDFLHITTNKSLKNELIEENFIGLDNLKYFYLNVSELNQLDEKSKKPIFINIFNSKLIDLKIKCSNEYDDAFYWITIQNCEFVDYFKNQLKISDVLKETLNEMKYKKIKFEAFFIF